MYNNKLIRRDIYRLIIPSLLENALLMLASFITAAMVGRLATKDIAAQGISVRVISIFWVLFRGIGIGATVAVAMQYGAGDLRKCRRIAEQAYLTVVPAAVILCLFMALFPEQLLRIFTQDPELISRAAGYLRLAVWYLPFAAVMSINTAVFTGQGNTRIPMYIATVLNLINIAVGYAAIFGIGAFRGMGLRGAIVATLASQISGCLLGLFLLYRPGGQLSSVQSEQPFFRLDGECLRSVYGTGLPAGCENVLWQLCAIVMSKVILTYGTNSYAAYQLGLQAEALTDMTALGFVTTSATLIAQAVGKKDSGLYQAYYRQLTRIAFVVSLFATGLLLLLPDQLMALLTDKADLRKIGSLYVFIIGFVQIPQVMTKVYSGTIRSAGGKRVPMYIAAIGIWGVRIPLILLFGLVLHLDIVSIWITIAADMALRMILSLLYFKKKDLLHVVDRLPQKRKSRWAGQVQANSENMPEISLH